MIVYSPCQWSVSLSTACMGHGKLQQQTTTPAPIEIIKHAYTLSALVHNSTPRQSSVSMGPKKQTGEDKKLGPQDLIRDIVFQNLRNTLDKTEKVRCSRSSPTVRTVTALMYS